MAGPSIVVRVLGDLKALGQSISGAGTAAESAASRGSKAFGGFLDGLNKTGVLGPFGGALAEVNTAIGGIIDHAKGIGPAMQGAGGALAGLGAVGALVGSKDQAAHQQLQAAIEATGKSYEDYGGKVETAIKHEENFGNTANTTQDALRTLTQATNDPAKALDLLGTATDLAAAKHESLSSAATSVGKAYNGNTRILKEFGITVAKQVDTTKEVAKATTDHEKALGKQHDAQTNLNDAIDAYNAKPTAANAKKVKTEQDKLTAANLVAYTSMINLNKAHDDAKHKTDVHATAVAELGKKLSGQASAGASTFMGHLDAMKAKLEDGAAQLGQKYGPALQVAGMGIMAMGTIWEVVGPMVQTGGEEAAAGEGLALGPIALIVLGIAALVVAVYELWTHWNTVWGWIKDAASAVWDWISANWPLLLGILLGPIGIAVGLIITHFQDVKAWAKDAYDFIVNTWNGIVGFFSGIVASIKGFFTGMWTDIKNTFDTAKTDIQNAWNWILGLFKAPSFSGFWDGIKEAFKAAINGIIELWNGIHFPAIGIGPFHTPAVSVPQIPKLAQGGLITADGFVYAHAGEAISPIPNGALGRSGPAVVINDAHFATELDVDSFMRRAAWVAQTAGV